jgi:hypothetical protein
MERLEGLLQYPRKERVCAEEKMNNQRNLNRLFLNHGKKLMTRNNYQYDSTTSSEQS